MRVVERFAIQAQQVAMHQEWVSNDRYSGEMVELLFQQYLYMVLRTNNTDKNFLPIYTELEIRIARLTGIQKRIADYIALHFLEEVSLDQIAQDLRYSKNHLCKAFKQETGTTIIEYVHYLRIQRANVMIMQTDKKLNEISALCGFSSVHYFTKIFHRVLGMTPTEARNYNNTHTLRADHTEHDFMEHVYFESRDAQSKYEIDA